MQSYMQTNAIHLIFQATLFQFPFY